MNVIDLEVCKRAAALGVETTQRLAQFGAKSGTIFQVDSARKFEVMLPSDVIEFEKYAKLSGGSVRLFRKYEEVTGTILHTKKVSVRQAQYVKGDLYVEGGYMKTGAIVVSRLMQPFILDEVVSKHLVLAFFGSQHAFDEITPKLEFADAAGGGHLLRNAIFAWVSIDKRMNRSFGERFDANIGARALQIVGYRDNIMNMDVVLDTPMNQIKTSHVAVLTESAAEF